MITSSNVLDVLSAYSDLEDCNNSLLLAESEKALSWVTARLKDGIDENNALIAHTAAAIAHYNLFIKRLSDTDRLDSYKAGDMTVKRNLKAELQLEQTLKESALADAAEILKDGGFFCIGN